jgi:hypothetical protein
MKVRKYFLILGGLIVLLAAQTQSGFSQNPDIRGRGGDYTVRNLDAAVNRLARGSKPFVKILDRELDRSRLDGTRLEDEINSKAKSFRDSAIRFEKAYRRGARDRQLLYHAQRMLDHGADLNRMLRRGEISPTVDNEWSRIYQDLIEVASWHRAQGRPSRF